MASIKCFVVRQIITCVVLFIIVIELVICGTSTVESTTTTTTAATTTTTTAATTTTTTASTTISANTDLAYCTCNLKPNQCDVNCCCDSDCTASDLLAFSSCTDQYTPVNTKACIQNSQVFINNTPYTVQVTQAGLFCVYYDNAVYASYYNPPTLVTNSSTFEYYMSRYGSYSYATSTAQSSSIPKTNNTSYYVSGDPIIVVYNTSSEGNGTLGMLGLPAASASSESCLNTNPAAYLYSQTNVCTQLIQQDSLASQCTGNPMLTAATYFKNFKIATTPSLFYTSNGTALPNVPLYDNAELISITTVNPVLLPVYTSANVCENAVQQVVYNIAYGGTSGISSASVEFTYANLTTLSLPLKQTFQTNFYQNGTSDNVTSYSGNPGYVVGEPVRAGTYVDSTSSILLGPVRSQWLTVVSSKADGLCVDSVQDRVPVRFGVNVRSGCFVSFTYNNMSSLCNESQYYAIRALVGNPLPPNRISPFGNTSVSNGNSWVSVLNTIVGPGSSCSLTSASPGLKDGQCNNIITGMNLQIVYANAGAINNPQPAIIGAEYQFYCQSALNFQCVGPYCQPSTLNTTAQKFEIFSSVSFVDASSPPVGAYGQIPTVSSTLPADFFYPFT